MVEIKRENSLIGLIPIKIINKIKTKIKDRKMEKINKIKEIENLKNEEIVNFCESKESWDIEELKTFENRLYRLIEEDNNFYRSIHNLITKDYKNFKWLKGGGFEVSNLEKALKKFTGWDNIYRIKTINSFDFIYPCGDNALIDYDLFLKYVKKSGYKGPLFPINGEYE